MLEQITEPQAALHFAGREREDGRLVLVGIKVGRVVPAVARAVGTSWSRAAEKPRGLFTRGLSVF
ncbi:hypothetical protein FTUN_2456 [Frigoriglobus tundricola]|uniref:Uncharacterized protein n=1 Tax=Frigoriglobus tundricola TaxID=2774151 RepID=A0A6M5YNI9_9BACT|nr:hypothetical protein FTUN_2456 [Frigoriglobus tundricola]